MKLAFHILPFFSLSLTAWFVCWMYMKTKDFQKLASKCGVRKSLFLKTTFIMSFTPVLNLVLVALALGQSLYLVFLETKVNFKRTWKSFED